MSDQSPAEITQILQDWNDGNSDAKERLLPFVYDELKKERLVSDIRKARASARR